MTPVGFADVTMSLRHGSDPVPWAVTFGVTTDLATYSLEDHANQVLAAFTSTYSNVLDQNVTIGPARLAFGQDGGDDIVIESTTPPIVGIRTSASLPQNSAVLVAKRTPFGGRRNRGRFYLPGALPSASVNEVGVIDPAYQTGLQNWTNAFLDELQTPTVGGQPPMDMVILHRPVPPSTVSPHEPTVVTSLVVDDTIATQRRRLRS